MVLQLLEVVQALYMEQLVNMKITYKILNPLTGAYVDTLSVDECTETFAKLAYELYLTYTHGTPVSIVIEEEGVETWRNCQGTEIVNPLLVQEQVGNLLEVL